MAVSRSNLEKWKSLMIDSKFLGKPFWDEGTTGLGSQRDRVSDLGRRLDLKCPLLPADPYQRAKAKFWADFIDKMVYPPSDKVWAANGEEQEAGKKEFIDGIKLLEGELKSNPYFGGETLGFLDIAFLPLYCWFHTFETFGKFSIEAECPKLVAWGKGCMEEEFVYASLPHPHKLYDMAVEYKKKLGI
uniref:Glutathione S-transferase n=1 Tax=Vitis vinifera TaxID=29760 RepID=A5BG71_VITVI|nr:hypothetical protein VITISV_001801 [Vitis vinifera]